MKWPFVLRSTYEHLEFVLKTEAEVMEAIIFDNRNLRKNYNERIKEIESLKAQLEQSQKNDTPKDPVTGKFVKKAD